MNINHLAVFAAVAEEGNLTRAAERLHISQPGVSKQLRELEKSLGLALFHRLSKGVRLTEAGELLAGYARQMFTLEKEAEQALAELRALERGRLTVGASTTIGVYLLPPVFACFRQMYPGIELRLEIANSRAIEKGVLANALDLGLSEGPLEAPELGAEVLLRDELVVIAAPDHPLGREENLSAERVCREAFIVREIGSGTRAVIENALNARGLTLRAAMSLGSSEAIKHSVAAGVGLAWMSRLAIAREVAAHQLTILPLVDLAIERPLCRLRLKGKYESRAAREFARLLKSACAPVIEQA